MSDYAYVCAKCVKRLGIHSHRVRGKSSIAATCTRCKRKVKAGGLRAIHPSDLQARSVKHYARKGRGAGR